MDRLALPDRAREPEGENLACDRSQIRQARGGAIHEATGSHRRRERPPRLAEVRHVESAPQVVPVRVAGRVVAHREQDAGVALPRFCPPPRGRGLGVKQDGRVPRGPRIGLLAGGKDRRSRGRGVFGPPGVVEPGGPEGGVPIRGVPGFGDPSDGLRHGRDVDPARAAESRLNQAPQRVGGQSAPWRTYGGTIEPFGTVVWAIRFHPLSSTPRPTCASAIRVNGPMTDSRPTLETPSMITPG